MPTVSALILLRLTIMLSKLLPSSSSFPISWVTSAVFPSKIDKPINTKAGNTKPTPTPI